GSSVHGSRRYRALERRAHRRDPVLAFRAPDGVGRGAVPGDRASGPGGGGARAGKVGRARARRPRVKITGVEAIPLAVPLRESTPPSPWAAATAKQILVRPTTY